MAATSCHVFADAPYSASISAKQQLRGFTAIERNRLAGEVLKRLFEPLHLAAKINASVDRVQRQVASGWRALVNTFSIVAPLRFART